VLLQNRLIHDVSYIVRFKTEIVKRKNRNKPKEEEMSFWNLAALQLEEFRPGINSKAEIGDNLIMVCMAIGPHKEDTGHKHPFDQCGIVLQGQIEMFIGDEQKILTLNETYFIPSGELHGWKTFDNAVKLLDISLKQD
jgi:quercetin dioxygenase-like cupin family protein